MKFTLNKEITYQEAVERMFEMLGDSKIMALASSVNDYVMVRNVCSMMRRFILRQIKISARPNSFFKIHKWLSAGVVYK